MGGKTNIQAPQPSEAEQALQNEQVGILRQQRDITNQQIQQQNLLAPVLYEQMGISPTKDAAGNITGYSKMPDDPNTAAFKQLQQQTLQSALEEQNNPQRKEIDQLLRQRTLSALKGDLPVDPGLERQLKEGRTTLEESLRKQLGSGYATSTPGIEALSNFDKRSTELRSAAQTGQLTLSEQLQQARAGTQIGNAQMALPGMELQDRLKSSNFGGMMQAGQGGWQGVGALGQNAAGYNAPLAGFANDRSMQMQANMANAQSANQRFGVFGSLFGTGLMSAAAAFGNPSDRRLKSKIRKLGKLKSGLNVYSYIIFNQPEIGVIADEARKLFPSAVKAIQGIDTVDYSQIR